MCGIAGFCALGADRYDELLLQSMTDVLSHRGPDDAGYRLFNEDSYQIGLGHRRLSILDLSANGHQPMRFGHLHLIFNGEIYNFREVQKTLIAQGYTFDSETDTEVILKSFHCWGTQCVHQFIGMFAFVLYDESAHQLYLFRDRAGVKPLYYYWDGQTLLFSSELKSFHQHPYFHQRKRVDINSLALFLQYSYIPAPHTIFHDTYKLKPGYFLTLDVLNKQLSDTKYWGVVDCYNQEKLSISEEEATLETERLLTKAYAYRMVADVPVGVFLSGGYDSVSVAALLQKDMTRKLKTFSIGFHENKFNEAPFAKEIAKHVGTDHTEYYITSTEAGGLLDELPDIYDEPFADNSIVPTTLLSQFARKHVTVALSADGGDEIFGGYNKFNQSQRYTNLFPRPLSLLLSGAMDLINPDYLPFSRSGYNFASRYEKMKNIWREGSPVATMKYIGQYITEKEVSSFLATSYKKYDTFFDTESQLKHTNDSLNKMLAIDYKTFLVDNNLVKVDRATMSVGLEGREPMLDHTIIEYVSRLPSDLKIRNGTNKYILKSIVHRHVPVALMDRPKMPFIAPLAVWFREQLQEQMKELLSYERLRADNLFNPQPIVRLRDRYLKGEPVSHQKLWNVLVFQLWYRRWMQ